MCKCTPLRLGPEGHAGQVHEGRRIDLVGRPRLADHRPRLLVLGDPRLEAADPGVLDGAESPTLGGRRGRFGCGCGFGVTHLRTAVARRTDAARGRGAYLNARGREGCVAVGAARRPSGEAVGSSPRFRSLLAGLRVVGPVGLLREESFRMVLPASMPPEGKAPKNARGGHNRSHSGAARFEA